MKTITVLSLVLILSGCAGFNLRQPERWIDNNILYSTKLPSVEIKVTPSLVFDKKESRDRLGISKEGYRRLPSGVEEDMFSFFDNSRVTRLSIIIENLTGQNWHMARPDYSSDPSLIVMGDETIGGEQFTTGIFKASVKGKPRLIKRFCAIVGDSTRYTLVYSTTFFEDLIHKPANMLSAEDWDYIYSFSKQANESFSISPYSGTPSPRQKGEQKLGFVENQQSSLSSAPTPLNPSLSLSRTYTDPTTGMEFILIPGDCFQMGDSYGGGLKDEKPVHDVCVDSFYIGKYEVTQGEYTKVINVNPSNFKKGDRYPVENISYNIAQSFITSLNAKSGKNFRLPTEAEWEYAARSGGGKNEKYSGTDDIDRVAWYDKNSDAHTHPVGEKKSNGFGLYDMSGNVRELCQDWLDLKYYSISPQNNPKGPDSGIYRVNRGGSWGNDSRLSRTASRYGNYPGSVVPHVGFRLVLPVQQL